MKKTIGIKVERMRECYFCKKKADKLYEFRGWEICWDCYFKKVDEDFDKKLVIMKKLNVEDRENGHTRDNGCTGKGKE